MSSGSKFVNSYRTFPITVSRPGTWPLM